jgi:two-component system sensor histidine kinase HydH
VTSSARLRSSIGVALAALVVAAGVVLLVTAWRTQRQAEAAAGLVARGQAGVWYDALAAGLGTAAVPAPATLQAFVDEHADDGLRLVAVIGARGEVLASGGAVGAQALRERELQRATHGVVTDLGDRLRVVMTGPTRPRRPGRKGPDRASPHVVIEFVDDAGATLRSSARTSLWAGAVAAVGCFVAAGVLLAWLRRQARQATAAAHAQRLASLGQMSATMAHELRNPLASLKGNAQLLVKMLPDSDRAHGKAERVVAEATRLEALTTELLEFARTGAITRTPASIAELCAEVASALPGKVEVDAEPRVSWRVDRARLQRALTNLVRNGLEASDGQPVTLRARAGRELVLEVCDRGPGVPPAERERIFEPFVTRRTSGTGLGLAVVRQVVELHGGQVIVDDAPGGGARFTVRIPA